MSNTDLFVFGVYLAGILVFGISFYRRGRTSGDYSTGSGTIPAWVIGLSIFATFVSSISYLALPGIAFLSDWNAFVFSLSIPFAILIAVRFFFSRLIQVLHQRFGGVSSTKSPHCYPGKRNSVLIR